MNERDDLRRELAEGHERLMRAVAGVTEDQFKRRPPAADTEPQPLSIAEVLAHLLATQRLWAGRIGIALSEDGAVVEPVDAAALEAQARAGRQAPVPQLIHGLLAGRRELELLLERAETEAGAVEDPLAGRLSVATMIETASLAVAAHAARVEALREAVGVKPVATEERA
jgi:hypothetical protein